MRFISTRGAKPTTAAETIVQGICPKGGLYVPETFPVVSLKELAACPDYCALAAKILSLYLTETPYEELLSMTRKAYASFDDAEVVPLHPLYETEQVMELWHGPTMAFKDVALQLLPHLMTDSLRRTGSKEKAYILVATSGDTGKAALEGFCGVEDTRVLVFYPHGGVSEAQRLQMVTQTGANTDVCAINGNFDDAQTAVKRIFGSDRMRRAVKEKGYRLSSANSINFGRLVPQIVYYFSAYLTMIKNGALTVGDRINFCVPTGNFGDILAGYYAMRMGLPVKKLIVASNRNNVLTDFFREGVYDANRTFHRSMSCSIDILISSNLERLLFLVNGEDAARTEDQMRKLKETGRYEITQQQRAELERVFYADWCTEEDTLKTIRRVYDDRGYLMDPHTAVGQTILERYKEQTQDETPAVLLSTANPYKFATAVLGAFETAGEDDFENARRLTEYTGVPVPTPFATLKSRPQRHFGRIGLDEIEQRVLEPLD